jgi:hypothetical protein
MKNTILLICTILTLSVSLSAQKYEPVTVKAGMKVEDCFPFNERYRYPKFMSGRIQLKNGVSSVKSLNYDFLSSYMVYLNGKDTLAIANAKDVRFISIAADTFYYYKGLYLEQVSGETPKVVLKQSIMLKETQKKDSYGTTSSGSATTSYGSLPIGGDFHKLIANEDMVFQRTLEYYISDPEGEFDLYNKRNVLRLFPKNEKEIKAYLKSEKINFEKRDDLIRLAEFLQTL